MRKYCFHFSAFGGNDKQTSDSGNYTDDREGFRDQL